MYVSTRARSDYRAPFSCAMWPRQRRPPPSHRKRRCHYDQLLLRESTRSLRPRWRETLGQSGRDKGPTGNKWRATAFSRGSAVLGRRWKLTRMAERANGCAGPTASHFRPLGSSTSSSTCDQSRKRRHGLCCCAILQQSAPADGCSPQQCSLSFSDDEERAVRRVLERRTETDHDTYGALDMDSIPPATMTPR